MASTAEIALLLTAKDLASGAVRGLGRSLTGVEKRAGGLNRAMGTLARVGIAAAVTAAAGLAGVLVKAVKSAAEEEKGIASLDAALRANVKGWDGNRAAIESVIASRIKLGFSDDEQRSSLTALIAKYRDVNEAQRVQAVAMDIARLKGISLAEATTMTMRAHDGSAKVLKLLGIELDKDATRTERLAAIQRVAAGQAQAYGTTAGGAFDVFKVSLDNVLENLGTKLLPTLTLFFQRLTSEGLPALEGIIDKVIRFVDVNRPFIDGLVSLGGQVAKVAGGFLEKLRPALEEVWSAITTELLPAVTKLWNDLWGDGSGLLAKGLTALEALMTGPFKDAVLGIISVFSTLLGIIGEIAKALDELIELMQEVTRRWNAAGFRQLEGVPVWLPPGTRFNTGANGPTPQSFDGPRRATGGWVGLGGPELAMVGEQGPEYVVPNHALRRTGMGGVTIQGISEREILDMVDRGLFFRLSRAPGTAGRV